MLIAALSLSLAAQAACPTGAEPLDDWTDSSSATRASAEAADALAALESYAFPDRMDEELRTGVRTDGLVIVRNGEVLYERYGRDWTADMPHLQWSATKSVAASTIGIAVALGELDVDASICDRIEVGNPDSCKVTTRHLMEHSTGWAWRETYEGQSPTASSVIGMLYGGGQADMARFVTGHALRDLPGTSYSYSSGNTIVQSAVAHAVLAKTHGEDYLQELLFGPLGITSAQFEHDQSGVPIGSSTLYLTPRDMARYGVFMLQDGCWKGERILPEGWMARTVTPAAVLDGKLLDPPSGANPGWNVWLNTAHPATNGGKLPWPDAPEDTFAALGHWRQSLYVMPHEGVVVARTGDDRDGSFQHNLFLAKVAALVDALPVPAASPADTTATTDDTTATTDDTTATTDDTTATTDDGTEATDGTAEATDDGTEATDGTAEATDDGDEATKDGDEAADDGDEAAAPIPGTFTPAAFPPPPMGPIADSSASPPDKYDVGLLRIATSFAALHGCACRYIAGRSEEACVAYIRVEPDVARARFDDATQTVTARALGLAKTEARPVGNAKGCALLP